MTDRWVCARCFTSAEESAIACPNCGLPRGASPESGAGEAAPSADAPARVDAAPTVDAATSAPVSPAPPPAPTPAWGTTQERWVCRRCFSSNDGTATACTNCGQMRDADASPNAADAWAGGVPAQPAEGQGRQFPWRLVIYGVIALVFIGGSVLFAARRGDSGEIVDAGNLSVFDLQEGDCFDAGLNSGQVTEISEVRAVPCAEPHVYEMFSVAEYPAGESPSAADADYTPWERENCLGRFEAYVGIDYDSSLYYISALVPTDSSWAQGDHTMMCFLHNDPESAMTGSARGAAQ
jgi:hypothetical protein